MKKIIFTEEQTKDIISKYINGLSTEKICTEFDVSSSTISKLLRSNGIHISGHRKNIDERKVISMYNGGHYTVSEICELFNVSKYKIRTVLKNNGIKSKTSKKYDYNDFIFENIDSEEKAYWLGFLYADGYVRKRSGVGSELRLKLSIKDMDHLIKFKKFISPDEKTPLVYEENKNSKCYKISINSSKIVDDLINKGCINKKSSLIEFPYFLNKELTNHFIRGYFDGDGSISFSDKQICLNFVSGSENFLKKLKKELSNGSNCKESNLVGSSDRFKYIQFSAKDDLYKIYDYLYKNSNVYMDRKFQKYTYIINNYFNIKQIINNKRRNNKNSDTDK